MSVYKLVDVINGDIFCYTHVVNQESYDDPGYANNKRIYHYLADVGFIKSVNVVLIIFEFYKCFNRAEVVILHHATRTYKKEPIETTINFYDSMLNDYLVINSHVETLTFDKNNSDETEKGSMIILEQYIGNLEEEKQIKADTKVISVKFIAIDKIM